MADADIEMSESSSSATTVKDKKRFEVKKVKIFLYICYRLSDACNVYCVDESSHTDKSKIKNLQICNISGFHVIRIRLSVMQNGAASSDRPLTSFLKSLKKSFKKLNI